MNGIVDDGGGGGGDYGWVVGRPLFVVANVMCGGWLWKRVAAFGFRRNSKCRSREENVQPSMLGGCLERRERSKSDTDLSPVLSLLVCMTCMLQVRSCEQQRCHRPLALPEMVVV